MKVKGERIHVDVVGALRDGICVVMNNGNKINGSTGGRSRGPFRGLLEGEHFRNCFVDACAEPRDWQRQD